MKEEEYLPEVWVDLKDDKIKGTEEKYSISSYGRVWNKLDKVFVSPYLTGIPQYFYVNLRVGEVRKQRRVHYLQAYSFYGEPPADDAGSVKKQTCDHIDINKFNNSLWNLRWASRKEQATNRRERKNTIKYVLDNYKSVEVLAKEYQYHLTKKNNGYTYEDIDEDQLDEIKRIVKVNNRGKRRIKMKCKKGYKFDGRKCIKISGKELVNKRRAIRKSVRTKRSKGSGYKKRIVRLSKRAIRKRRSMGLKR